MGRLNDKSVLITGGSRGIGRAIAVAFANEGARIALNYISNETSALETLDELNQISESHVALQADVRSLDECETLVDETVSKLGRLDVLVNNAGILTRASFLELDPEEFKRIIETNLIGAFNIAHAAARIMSSQGGGIILNTSSIAARRAYRNLAHYCSSKAALSMLTKSMALELAPHRIRVNELCPGLVETDLNRSDLSDPEFRRSRVDNIPLGRVGRPRDLVEAAIYLCSDQSDWVTGASIVIDGGASVTP